jgi:hypothetical protein
MFKTITSLFLLFMLCCLRVQASYSGSFTVNGDLDKFYPVLFEDKSWNSHKATELEIGRSNVHENSDWRGSVIARFRYHVTNWGNGSSFIEADLRQSSPYSGPMIAGWTDPTSGNSNVNSIIIWLKGGGTTYNFITENPITPLVFDNVSNSLPYQELNGPAHTYKTAPDPYVNSSGLNSTGTASFAGGSSNYFAGSIGIGTTDTYGNKLAVNGTIRAKEVKVEAGPWPDYVFTPAYRLSPLTEVKSYIDKNGHLPEMPAAAEVAKEGIALGEMNKKLLQKVEELTLYLIEENRSNQQLKSTVSTLQNEVALLRQQHTINTSNK